MKYSSIKELKEGDFFWCPIEGSKCIILTINEEDSFYCMNYIDEYSNLHSSDCWRADDLVYVYDISDSAAMIGAAHKNDY